MSKDKYSRRRLPKKELRDKVLIMCSGETEEIYFNHFKNKGKLNNVSIKVAIHKKGNLKAVVKAALMQKPDYDEIWAVFDKDDFLDFDEAIRLAEDGGIQCAFSNEAFEYWFLLHFESKTRTGAISRDKLNYELGKHLGYDYDKKAETIRRVCDRISGRLASAEEKARAGYEWHKCNSGHKPSMWCSCTTVNVLTKRLREWGNAK